MKNLSKALKEHENQHRLLSGTIKAGVAAVGLFALAHTKAGAAVLGHVVAYAKLAGAVAGPWLSKALSGLSGLAKGAVGAGAVLGTSLAAGARTGLANAEVAGSRLAIALAKHFSSLKGAASGWVEGMSGGMGGIKNILKIGEAIGFIPPMLKLIVPAAKIAVAGIALTVAALVPLALGLRSAVQAAVAFDTKMRDVNAITQDSEADFHKMSASVLNLSRTSPQSLDDLATALYNINSAGVQGAAGLQLLAIGSKAAVAGATDATTASTAIIQVANAFSLQTSSMEDMNRVADMLFKTVQIGIVTFPELAQGIGEWAPAAAAAKIPLEQVGALISAQTLAGADPAQVAVQTGRFVEDAISNPSPQSIALQTRLGVSFKAEAQDPKKGIAVVIDQLRQAAANNPELLQDLIPDVRARRGATELFAQNGTILGTVMAQQGTQAQTAGAQQAAYNQQMKAASAQLGILHNQFTAFKTAVGLGIINNLFQPLISGVKGIASVLGPSLRNIGETVTNAFTGMGHFAESMRFLAQPIAIVAKALAALGAAITYPLKAMTEFFAKNRMASTALGVALTALTVGGIAKLVAAAGGLASLIGRGIGGVIGKFDALGNGIARVARFLHMERVAEWFANPISRALKAVESGFASMAWKVRAALLTDIETLGVLKLGLLTLGSAALGAAIGDALGRAAVSARQKAFETESLTGKKPGLFSKATLLTPGPLIDWLNPTPPVPKVPIYRQDEAIFAGQPGMTAEGSSAIKGQIEKVVKAGGFTAEFSTKMNAAAGLIVRTAMAGEDVAKVFDAISHKSLDEVRALNAAAMAGVPVAQQLALTTQQLDDQTARINANVAAIAAAGSQVHAAALASANLVTGLEQPDPVKARAIDQRSAILNVAQAQHSLNMELQGEGPAASAAKIAVVDAQRALLDSMAAHGNIGTETQQAVLALGSAQRAYANLGAEQSLARQQAQLSLEQAQQAAQQWDKSPAAIKAFYDRTLGQARDFNAKIAKATEYGLNPQTIQDMITAGPTQALPVLDTILQDAASRTGKGVADIVAAASTGLVGTINAAQAQLEKLSTRSVEIARITATAVAAKSSEYTKALPGAMKLDEWIMSHQGDQAVAHMMAGTGLSADQINQYTQMFGLGGAQLKVNPATGQPVYAALTGVGQPAAGTFSESAGVLPGTAPLDWSGTGVKPATLNIDATTGKVTMLGDSAVTASAADVTANTVSMAASIVNFDTKAILGALPASVAAAGAVGGTRPTASTVSEMLTSSLLAAATPAGGPGPAGASMSSESRRIVVVPSTGSTGSTSTKNYQFNGPIQGVSVQDAIAYAQSKARLSALTGSVGPGL